MRVPAWAWGAVLGVAVALEAVALASRTEDHSDTATATIRRTLGIDPPRRLRPVAVAGVVAGCVWLAVHLTKEAADAAATRPAVVPGPGVRLP